jgi:hypothetical protein
MAACAAAEGNECDEGSKDEAGHSIRWRMKMKEMRLFIFLCFWREQKTKDGHGKEVTMA